MIVTLYVFADSHPCEAVVAAARAKGLEVRAREIPPVIHRLVMPLRFGLRHGTVPGMIADGSRVHGTSAIMRALDGLAPQSPALFPGGDRGTAIAQAEAWGEGNVQDMGRRLIWGHLSKSPEAMAEWSRRSAQPLSRLLKRRLGRPICWIARTANGATAENVEADLAALSGVLDHIDDLIATGVIAGAEPNAADFQILSSVGVWMALADLRPAIIDRPCGQASVALFPGYVARPPVAAGVLPAAWFEPLRAATIVRK